MKLKKLTLKDRRFWWADDHMPLNYAQEESAKCESIRSLILGYFAGKEVYLQERG